MLYILNRLSSAKCISMNEKFDLKRLQVICRYGSYGIIIVMAIFMLLLFALVVLLFIPEVWQELIDAGIPESEIVPLIVVLIATSVIMLLVLGIVYKLMKAISKERTPFTIKNVKYIKIISVLVLIAGLAVPVIENLVVKITYPEVDLSISINFFMILAAVAMYCLSLVFQYGVYLQTESDQTL